MRFLFISSPKSNEEHRHMWEEVALRYQQILHREYRMLNLPSYPVQGGNVYLYYVPVVINPQLVSQNHSIYNECDSKSMAVDETSDKYGRDVIYISDDSDDSCGADVKEEPLECAQTVERTSSFGNHIKVEGNNEGFFPGVISCERENNDYDNVPPPTRKNEALPTIKVKKESNDLKNSLFEYEQDTKVISGKKGHFNNRYDNESVKHFSDNSIEVREDHIRIIKGYTIEYHPLHPVNAVNRWHIPSELESQPDINKVEKIQDLKKRLANQEQELEKLRLQQSAVDDDVFRRRDTNGMFQRKCADHGTWKRLRDCPSTQIHYFPSGERKTSNPRRNTRKQTLPRRIDILSDINKEKDIHPDVNSSEIEIPINGDVNCSVRKRKRNLTPFPVLEKEKLTEVKGDKPVVYQHNSPKGALPSKKVKGRRKRRKARHTSHVSDQNLEKRSQSWCNKTQTEPTCVRNTSKATAPEDITQDEFLSIFGLLRMPCGQRGGTL